MHLALVGLGEALADLDGGGLAGAVGAQQAEAFAGPDLEVESVYGDDVGVSLAEAADEERWELGDGLAVMREGYAAPGCEATPASGGSRPRRTVCQARCHSSGAVSRA